LLQGAASSEVSRTLNSLVSKLDSRTSAIVVDSALSPTLLAQQTKTRPFPEVKTDRKSKSLSSPNDLSSLDAKREGKSLNSGLSSYGSNAIPSDDKITTIAVQSVPNTISTVTASSVINDLSNTAIVTAGQSAYATDNAYDDAVADPERDCYYSGTCDPSVVNSGSYTTAAAYKTASANYAASVDNTYDDAVADPEPAGYYSGNSAAAGVGSGNYNVIDNSNYGSQSQGTVPSYADAVSSVYDPYDSADPEPSAIPYSTSGTYGQ
jgi:hypothetical protein